MSNTVVLADRIKELSYTVGTGNFHLNGAAQGFSSFGSQYNYNTYLFYAITDGTRYEVGSGQYILDGVNNALRRFPFKSSNSNQVVNFPAGLKEVYVTYPATHSVYTGSGISNLNFPQKSGVAVWSSSNILNYDNNIVWDSDNKRLGIINQNPEYGIHVGGNGQQSSVFASGFYVGTSGIYFPSGNNGDSGYQGGRQLAHFVPNELGDANTQAVLELSGVVDNIFFFKKQNAGLVFAGPPSGCSPPCSPAYPSFRPLVINDIEDLVDISGTLSTNLSTVSGIAQYGYNSSGVLRTDLTTISGIVNNVSGVLRTDITVVSGVARYGYDSSGGLRTDLATVSGIARHGYDSSGVLRTDLTTVSGIARYGYDSSGVLRTDITTVSGIAQYGYNSSGIIYADVLTVSGLINTHVHGNISNSGTIGSTSGLMVVTGSGGYIQTSVLPAPYFATITNYNDTGTSGQMTFDSDYVYFNVPSGDSPTGLVWKRAAISIWG